MGDVGGPGKQPPPNESRPRGQRGQLYNIDTISSRAGFGRKRFVIGAAQGPWDYLNKSSEVRLKKLIIKIKDSSTFVQLAQKMRYRGENLESWTVQKMQDLKNFALFQNKIFKLTQ